MKFKSPSRPELVDVWQESGRIPPVVGTDWWRNSTVGEAAKDYASAVSPLLSADLYGEISPDKQVCRQGVSRAMEKLMGDRRVTAPNGKSHFLIADGTGTGKGFQVMLVAAMCAEKSGKPSLVLTRPDLVGGLLKDGARLGIHPDRNCVRVMGFHRSEDYLARCRREGRELGLIALDEAHDLVKLPCLRSEIDQAPAFGVLFVSATPFVNLDSAVYFLSRLAGVPELAVSRQLQGDKSGAMKAIERINGELYSTGALIRREFPFWGEIGEMEVHPLSAEQRRRESQLLKEYSQRLQADGTAERGIDALKLDKELRLLSDEALIEPAAQEIEKNLKAGRKVIFYGTDGDTNLDIHGKPKYRGLLSGIQERLSQRGIVAAKMSDMEERFSPNGSQSTLRNSIEANRFIDAPLLNERGESCRNEVGQELVGSLCDVILMPPSQSAGWSDFCQRYETSKPVAVVSSLPERADDLQQQEGRVSRISSCGPGQAKIIAMNSIADQERINKIAAGNTFLKAMGSLWVRAHDDLQLKFQGLCSRQNELTINVERAPVLAELKSSVIRERPVAFPPLETRRKPVLYRTLGIR